METRGDIGWYNPGTDEYTVWMSSQTPHIQRLLLAAFVTGIPEHKVRCISPDVGGAFGTKIFCYADMALCMFASKAIGGRPVKWVEGRRENYQSTIHGRDHITYLEIAGKRDGEITGLRVKTLANLGGRLSTIGPGIPTTLYARVLHGCYRIPNIYAEVTGVYTNTTFVDAYRGAGRPEATYVIERAMDLFAAEIGMDRAEIRRQNFIQPDQFPYENPSGLGTATGGAKIYIDSGNYEPAMDKALAMVGYADLAARKAEAKRRGKLLGVGLSTYIEVCGVAPVEVDRRGRRGLGRRDVGVVQHQGPPDRQGRRHDGHPAAGPGPRDDVRPGRRRPARRPDGGHHHPALRHAGHAVRLRVVRQPDVVGRHDRGDQGGRQGPGEGPALRRPHARGVVDDIEIDGAEYRVKGSPDRKKTIQEIAFALDLAFDAPEGMEPYLDETAYYDTPNCTWPFGTHIAIVEIDEETGEVDLVRYVAVDDVGNKINPLIVDGQLHGGIAQGVGQALWEGAVYSDEGQLLSGSMLDYALPKAVAAAELRARQDGHAVAGQPARGQGRRRGRGDRHRRPPSPTRSSTRSRRSASGTSTCRTRPRRCGARSSRRREARHDPGRVRLPAGDVASTTPSAALAGGDAKVIAGGMSLLPLMKLRLAQPATLVDIGRLVRAQGLAADRRRRLGGRGADDLRRGARGHQARLRPRLHQRASATSRSATGAPSAGRSATPTRPRDLPALALALDYSAVLRSSRGERTVPLDGFFKGAFETAIAPDELLVKLRPRAARRRAPTGSYQKLEHPASGYSIVGVVRGRRPRPAASITHARVALTGVGEVAYRAKAVEDALPGRDGSADAVARRRRARRRRPDRQRRHPRRPRLSSAAWRWSTPAARSRPRSAASTASASVPACASSGSSLVGARPGAWPARSSRAT